MTTEGVGMICPTCHGADRIGPLPIPCEDCGGSGVGYCCGGDCVQPGYDPEVDAIGCYNDAVRAIGAKVKAGAPVPEFFLSQRK